MSETVQSATMLELATAVLQQLPRDISQETAMEWIRRKKELGKALRAALIPSDQTPVTPVGRASSLLEFLRTAECSAQETFKATDFFKEKDSRTEFKKFWLGDNFKANFLKGAGKIELDVPAAQLNVYELRKVSQDSPIITALGGKDAAKTYLAYMAKLIKAQPKGQPGELLTNGRANIFYVENDNGELWAVLCDWRSDYRWWHVEAFSITDPDRWIDGCRFFSPAVLAA